MDIPERDNQVYKSTGIALQGGFTFPDSFSSKETIRPKSIFPDENDEAIERGLTLFELTKLLENQRLSRQENKTIILGLFPYNRTKDQPPKGFKEAMSIVERLADRSFHYYDYLGFCLATEDLPDHVSNPVYPIPPFFERTFDLDYREIGVLEMISFLIFSDYADRVVLLPRIRGYRGSDLERDYNLALEYLGDKFPSLRDDFDLLDMGKLSSIPTATIRKTKIPVYEAADLASDLC